MEIADAFVINKADRADADMFSNNLKKIIHQKGEDDIPVFLTSASQQKGIDDVTDFILSKPDLKSKRKELLLTEKAYKIIQQHRMAGIDKKKLQQNIAEALINDGFNLYQFIDWFLKVSG